MRLILPAEKNPALREMSRDIPVADIQSAPIRKLISDMKALLAKEQYGVALAANQVGEPLKLFIVSGKALAIRQAQEDSGDDEENEENLKGVLPLPDQVYINPELVKTSRSKKKKHEGCGKKQKNWI